MTYLIPDAALANHIAILGKTGSGKTSTEKLAVEHAVAAGFRVCVLDSVKSDWWGITSSAEGTRPGLPFKILGGPRGHALLPSSAGKVIGQLVGTGKLPLSIIDMADFEPGGLQRFFNDFAPALMRHARGVLYLVIEEAHEFAPKERSGIGAETTAIHWAKKLATAGRSKGIRLIVASQRVQALHNAVLGSCETVIAHRLSTPADQKPVIDWLKANTDKATQEEVAASLSSLPTGTGWLCSGEARIFERVAFPKFATYDNTATPTADSEEIAVATAAVDHEELLALIGDAAKEAEANDPKALKAEVAKLTRELAAAKTATNIPGNIPSAPWPDQRQLVETLTAELTETNAALERLTAGAAELRRCQEAALAALTGERVEIPALAPRQTRPSPAPAPVQRQAAPVREARQSAPAPEGGLPKIPGGAGRPLAILAGVYPAGMTRGQLAGAAGIKKSGSTLSAYLSKLRSVQMIEERGGLIYATESGALAVGDVELPPAPGPELARWWASRVGGGQVVEHLLSNPGWQERDDIALALSINPQGSTLSAYISKLFTAGVVEKSGGSVRLTSEVIGNG